MCKNIEKCNFSCFEIYVFRWKKYRKMSFFLLKFQVFQPNNFQLFTKSFVIFKDFPCTFHCKSLHEAFLNPFIASQNVHGTSFFSLSFPMNYEHWICCVFAISMWMSSEVELRSSYATSKIGLIKCRKLFRRRWNVTIFSIKSFPCF